LAIRNKAKEEYQRENPNSVDFFDILFDIEPEHISFSKDYFTG